MTNQAVLVFLLFFSLAGLVSCGQETAQPPESPMMSTERPGATTVSEPIPLPSTGHGNFENLVADYENNDRSIWQQPDLVISFLGDLEGKTVADIGAGSGYFTFRLVPKASRVIGIDIDPRCIEFMDSGQVRLPEKYRDRFESRLAKPEDPLLKPGEANAVIIVNTYGYLEKRVEYLTTLKKGMSPGGQLLIIDFKKNNLPVGPAEEFKVALPVVEKELTQAGFEVTKLDTKTLDFQYIVLAKAGSRQ
ncbi:MAG: class I SAM-dependent methyltransferase [Saprospiraceae bacterium]|nr:class I SAM-dependent methyltransferase [Saprospiraceae bacterium]